MVLLTIASLVAVLWVSGYVLPGCVSDACICATEKHLLLPSVSCNLCSTLPRCLLEKQWKYVLLAPGSTASVNSSSKFLCATAVGSHSVCRLNVGMFHSDVPCGSVLWVRYESWRYNPDRALLQFGSC